MKWITDEFPPIAEGLKNVSIEVEAHLESGKIIPIKTGIWQKASIHGSRRQ